MSKNDITICSAYMCPSASEVYKVVNGVHLPFCYSHCGMLTHGQSVIILELISSSRIPLDLLETHINFDVVGYTRNELSHTITHLIDTDILSIVEGILVSSESRSNCDFYGCKLKKRPGSTYCANHKIMPDITLIDSILSSISLTTKNISSICQDTGIDSKVVRSTMAQLLKFGYVVKEKRGITNYYIST